MEVSFNKKRFLNTTSLEQRDKRFLKNRKKCRAVNYKTAKIALRDYWNEKTENYLVRTELLISLLLFYIEEKHLQQNKFGISTL